MFRNPVLVLGMVLFNSFGSYGAFANDIPPTDSNGIPLSTRNEVPAKSKKSILSIKDDGLSNKALKLNEKDGSVFFFNDSSSDELTLSIAWGNRAAHCASDNLKLEKDGSLHTVRPMKKKDFSVVCFPESGEYTYFVTGLPAADGRRGNLQVDGKIIVP
jgi:hypothetical protein